MGGSPVKTRRKVNLNKQNKVEYLTEKEMRAGVSPELPVASRAGHLRKREEQVNLNKQNEVE